MACASYERIDEDLDLVRDLGVDAYRFSIAWPRVQPTGTGPANTAGLDFYERVVDGLLSRGIEPLPTLYHWDLPQPSAEVGIVLNLAPVWPEDDGAQGGAHYVDAVQNGIWLGALLDARYPEVLSYSLPLPRGAKPTGSEVAVGIRPENLKLVGDGKGIRVIVELVEELGSDAFLHGSVQDDTGSHNLVVARVDPKSPPEKGETIALAPAAEQLHWFDPATGERLAG